MSKRSIQERPRTTALPKPSEPSARLAEIAQTLLDLEEDWKQQLLRKHRAGTFELQEEAIEEANQIEITYRELQVEQVGLRIELAEQQRTALGYGTGGEPGEFERLEAAYEAAKAAFLPLVQARAAASTTRIQLEQELRTLGKETLEKQASLERAQAKAAKTVRRHQQARLRRAVG